MIDINDKNIKNLTKVLKRLGNDAFPKAVRSTLDATAYKTSQATIENVYRTFTVRGKSNIVIRSIRYEKCGKGLDISRMEAKAGQIAKTLGKKTEQLRKQELGETIVSKSKYLAKPTQTARGGSFINKVPRKNYKKNIQAKRIDDIARHASHGSTYTQFAQAIAVVHNTHKTTYFIPDKPTIRKKYGIFKIVDTGTHINNRGKRVINGHAAKLVYKMQYKAQKLRPQKTLEPATNQAMKEFNNTFAKEADRRIEKEMQKLA